ncbi:hypothetical protein BJF79_11695 [Actinomadura sp. CNU-125]|uniref:hypothetical protein n=1 Tax=Actinomadura sp. CNU-125 TaxID=1904961 RepID=UPI00096725AC|nr:hypothetical protein [Actinomadura sp. CNU-125]OLT27527.1 hypothetical protein BJF79_11695 [Actinomadura sp. CNU-125]
MAETDYWLELEYRVCRELRGFADDRIRSLWCDGFIPEETDVRAPDACVRGRAWIGDDSGSQEQWTFTLLVGDSRSEDEIDWSSLLPADDTTGWLVPDPAAKKLTMDPLSATPE